MMKIRIALLGAAIACATVAASCKPQPGANTAPPNQGPNAPVVSKTPGPLPDRGYKAQIAFPDTPLKLRAGEKQVLMLKVKNASEVIWWARGGETNDRSDNKFYIAAGNRWLNKDGKRTPDTEGHSGISRDLKPGDEIEVPLQVTAPKEPGEYTIELDMVQEGVNWFGDKGSPTTKVKVTVAK